MAFAPRFAPMWAGAVLTALPRTYLALKDHSVFWPDEIYQSIEPAHRIAFGYGLISWEFRDGARSWILPGVLAIILKIGSIFTDRSVMLIEIVKLFMVAVAVLTTVIGVALAERLAGKRAAWLAALLISTFPPLLVFSHRATPEMISAPLLVLALWWGATSPRRAIWAGATMGLALIFRMQTAPIAMVLVANFLRLKDYASAARFVSAASAVFGLGGLVDWLTWGRPFNSTVEYMVFTLRGGASTFGVDPPSFYLKTLWTAAGPSSVLVCLGLLFAFRDHPALVVAVLAFVFGHVLIPHKEFRFISPAMPVALTAAAAGLVRLMDDLKAPKWLSGVVAGACFLSGAAKAPTLKNQDLGLYPGHPYGPASVWGFGQDPTLLLARAGERPDLCGILTLGLRAGFTGGYSYLHRPVPLLYRHQLCDDHKSANYLIAAANAKVPDEFRLVERSGETALFRRPGKCVAPEHYDYLLEGAHDMGLNKAQVQQPDKKQLKISAGTSGSVFVRGWGTGETLGCQSVRWAIGTKAEVEFPLEPTENTYTLSFTAHPFGRTLPQEAKVNLNGSPIGQFTLEDGWKGYQSSIPAQKLRRGMNKLEFAFTRAVRASDSDPRELAALFDQIAVTPVTSSAEIDVGSGSGRSHLGEGFSVDEQSGQRSWAWSDGPRSRATVTLAGSSQRHVLEVVALAYAPTVPQTVKVKLNGHAVGALEIPARWSRRGLLLEADLIRQGENQLDFEYSSTRRPVDVDPAAKDGRSLAVMFDQISVQPAPSDMRIDFGDASAHPHQLAGFSGDERADGRSAVWSDAPISRFVIGGHATPGEHHLDFELRAFEPLERVRVDVFVNGKSVGVLQPAPAWDTLGVEIPDGVLRREANVVELRYARTATPKDTLPDSTDERELAIQIDSVVLQAEKDEEDGAKDSN
jgi:GPI mannosyltransferase 3